MDKNNEKNYDILMLGHISKDIIIVGHKETKCLGGAVYYSSFSALASGANVLVVTKVADEDKELLKELSEQGIDFVSLPSNQTTSIQNRYTDSSMERRQVALISQASAFELKDIPDIKTNIYHLAGLFAGEIPTSLIAPLAKKGKVALDVQGVIRCSKGGKLLFKDWENKQNFLPYITYLKTDAAEAEILTGEMNRAIAAKKLYKLGANEVMITYNTEVIIYDGRKIYSAAFTSKNLCGRTGRGDTCFAAYLSKRMYCDIQDSLNFAAELTSRKMEKPGPFRGSLL